MSVAERDPFDLAATPARIRLAARAARLSEAAVERGVDLAIATPSAAEWRRFLSGTLAMLGSALLLAGAICFVAYNWARIGRYGKFALVEIGIIGAVLLARRWLPELQGRIALFAACVLVGPLLGVYGQTYQTGADPYGLFLTWCLLILPWAWLGRFGAIWLLALFLIDLALALFHAQVLSPRNTATALWLPVSIAALHAGSLVAWEWQMRRAPPVMDESWVLRVIGVVGFLAVFIPAAIFVFDDRTARSAGLVGLAGLLTSIVAVMWYYGRARHDRFMITLAGATGMAWATVLAARVIFDWLDLQETGLFVMAGLVIWEIAFGLKLYRRARAT